MIQRIQSVWLLLASITISCLLFLPMITVNSGSTEFQLFVGGIYQKTAGVATKIESFLPLMISTIAVALLCLANIFNFKNRSNQRRLVIVSIVLIMGLSFWCSRYAQKIPGGLENGNYYIGMFLPVIAIIFCSLAIRGINNDEKLIKSADRLR